MDVSKPSDIGKAVRTRRRSMGLTQTDLAFAAGTGVRFISELERGKPTARLGDVLKVLAALGLSLSIDE